MSQQFPGEDLSPFEAQLAQLLPRPAQVGRDEILFEAGRQDAFRQQRRVLYKWHAACAVLLVVVCGQWFWLPAGTSPSASPVIADTSPSVETPNAPGTTQLVEDTPQSSLPVHVQPDDSGSLAETAPRSPSLWQQLLPTPAATPAAVAMGHDLSVGSLVYGIPSEAFATPKPGSIPADDQPILSPMHRLRLAE